MSPGREGDLHPPAVEVVVYVREGCHLCVDALATLERLRTEDPVPFVVRAVDIEASDELHRRYLERIPVVAVAGEELGDFFVDAPRVLAAVRAARRAAGRGAPAGGDRRRTGAGDTGRADGAA